MSSAGKPSRAPDECPVCGANLPSDARACPECGSDERTGWNEENTRYDGVDLPDEAFDRDEMLKEEGLERRLTPKGVSVFWWIIGVGMLALFVLLVLRGAL